MNDRIYHNPRCMKSRQTLALLTEQGENLPVIEYLKHPPTEAELAEICELLGVEPVQIIRSKEGLFKELGLSLKDDRSREDWLTILTQHPRLIERPIVIKNGKAALGRPPENVLELLQRDESGVTKPELKSNSPNQK